MGAFSKRVPTGNRLLDRLADADFARLAPHLEPVSLVLRQSVYKVNDPAIHVYFPRSGVFSMFVVMEDGRGVEIAAVGNEGMVLGLVALGLDFVPHEVTIQVPGESLRMQARTYLEVLRGSVMLDAVMRRYVAVCCRNAHQILACNAVHPVDKRLCRWLLMMHDRVGLDEFPLTQDLLAEMLGVRRQTVSAVVGQLHRARLIQSRRGKMRIIDRRGLEAATCECYAAMHAFLKQVWK
jgi:CRP-like cAMP-binding protein